LVKVVVTGGTGFVGRHLVRRLAKDNHSVAVLSHRSQPPELPAGVVAVRGNVEDVDSLKKAFDGADAVFHLVGLIVETKEKTYERTVTQGTAHVVDAACHCGVKKIVYLSALGTSVDASTRYHQSKYKAEQAVMGSGMNSVIFRAAVIFGPGDGFVSLLARIVRWSPVTPVIGHGRYPFQPIYIDDLVEVMARSLAVPEAGGMIIDAAGPRVHEYRELLAIIRKTLHKRRVNLFIPLWLVRPMVAVTEMLLRPAPLTGEQLAMMEMGSVGDIGRMQKLFGVTPVTFEEGLKRYLR
jgi:uncharacterized protein YbjT (DUF2867 family)